MKRISIVLIFLLFTTYNSQTHPLKMAYTAVKYIPAKQIFEVNHRVFQDDFENTLKSRYGYKYGDVVKNQSNLKTIEIINRFFGKNFSMSFNNQKQKLKYKRIEQQNQMGILVCYETEKVDVAKLTSVAVYDFIMMEEFEEQVNLFNININGFEETAMFDIKRTKEVLMLKR